MKLDYLTIFPAYLEPLKLSLPGKAIDKGLLEIAVHDLRSWTHDRHNKVDDTPYGGGAGMVMKPEPFGEAFDELGVDETTTVIFTTPSGEPMTQALAADLATRSRLVFACGRYEGIDQRVIDHARTIAEVREVSLGDYVLNGGEVAALAITEAVVRLLPGFMGNAESLVEESHQDGLLEYPVFTKPPVWREREVPAILTSGDHGKVAAWRHQQQLERTAARRPDLLHISAASSEWEIAAATPADAAELLVLQRACWVQEAISNETLSIPALHEDLEAVAAGLAEWQTYTARIGGRLVGSVRGRRTAEAGGWEIGRLMAAPDLQGRGLGRALLAHIEAMAPSDVKKYVLFTGAKSVRNLKLYKKAGYRQGEPGHEVGTVTLGKIRRGTRS